MSKSENKIYEGDEADHKWFISAGGWGDGKSVCLWLQMGAVGMKIARFQCKEAARIFIRDYKFPVSDRVQAILNAEEEQ